MFPFRSDLHLPDPDPFGFRVLAAGMASVRPRVPSQEGAKQIDDVFVGLLWQRPDPCLESVFCFECARVGWLITSV